VLVQDSPNPFGLGKIGICWHGAGACSAGKEDDQQSLFCLHRRLGKSRLLLGGAIRFGCVTMSLDMYLPHDNVPPQDSPHANTSQREKHCDFSSAEPVQQQVTQEDGQLVGCIPEVVGRWMCNTQLTEHLEPGTVMTVQVGLIEPCLSIIAWLLMQSCEICGCC